MYEIHENIDVKMKFTKNIYMDTIIYLTIAFVFFSFTGYIVTKNLIATNLYMFFGLFVTFNLVKISSKNPDRKNISSIMYYFKRNKDTIKSIDYITEKKNGKKKKLKIKSKTLQYIDVLDIKDNGYIPTKYFKYLEIFEIQGIDLNNLVLTDRQKLINNMGEFYISYTKDIKFIYTKFSLDFSSEKEFLKNKLEEEKDEYKRLFLKSKLTEFELLEKNRQQKSYFLFCYGKSELDLEENVKQLKIFFPFRLKVLTTEQKEKLFFKLNNMSYNF